MIKYYVRPRFFLFIIFRQYIGNYVYAANYNEKNAFCFVFIYLRNSIFFFKYFKHFCYQKKQNKTFFVA